MGKLTLILLCAFVAFLPFEMMAYFEDAPSGSKLVGLVVLTAALVAFFAGHPLRLPSLPVVMRIVIVLFAAVSYGWSIDREGSLTYLLRLAQLLIFFLLIWEFAVTYDDQLWVLRSFLIGMLVPMVMALLAFRGASQIELESGERFSGGGHDLNYLAYMFSVSILIAIYLSRNQRPLDHFLRWAYWGFAAWCVVQALLTGSRGGMLSLLATAFFAAFMLGMKFRKITVKTLVKSVMWLLLLIGAATPIALWLVPQELLDRVTLKGGGGTSLEDDPRVRIWTRGWEVSKKAPVLGHGIASFFVLSEDSKGHKSAPHNTYLSVLVELGIVGLALYLLFLALLLREAWRLPHRERLLWIGILSITLLNCFTCGSQSDKFTWFLYAMAAAQGAALGPLANKRRNGPPLLRGVAPPVIAPFHPGLRKS
jgi:O-antigen ligase